ncbi:MAG: T9SS type A sorting domain-containing protein [Pseudoflavonifractor sp.]|nr:T9SS type A sorting domain-containing protein [Alloprevotella sp.]MCM1116646.1 T9SS type A sorting domain-containing protein [Pseudoflavonifractor sp.]
MKKTICAMAILAVLAVAPCTPAAPVSDVEALGHVDYAAAPAVKVTSDGIELYASAVEPTTFMIYSITGQLVKKTTVEAAAHVNSQLPEGCYIVRCSSWAKKVVVK